MTTLKQWVENEFNPWKEAMQKYESQQTSTPDVVKKNAFELKYILALLLEKREAEAVKSWNSLGLEPQLKKLEFNPSSDTILMEALNGEKEELSVTTLIEELEQMFNG